MIKRASLFDLGMRLGDDSPTQGGKAKTVNAAKAARDRAIKRVHDGATVDERELVRAALDAVIEHSAQQNTFFTSEDVIAEMGPNYKKVREPRLLGALMRQASAAGRIVAGEFTEGTRPERHNAPIRKWRAVSSRRPEVHESDKTTNGSPVATAAGAEQAAG